MKTWLVLTVCVTVSSVFCQTPLERALAGTALEAGHAEWLTRLVSTPSDQRGQLLRERPSWADAQFVVSCSRALATSHRSMAILRIPLQEGVVALASSLGEQNAFAVAQCALADLLFTADKLERARAAYEEAVVAARASRSRVLEGECFLALAQTNLLLGETSKARKSIEEAREVFSELDSAHGLARCFLAESRNVLVRGMYREALAKADEAARHAMPIKEQHPNLWATILLQRANAYYYLDKVTEAEVDLRAASGYAASLDNPRLLGRCKVLMADLRRGQERYGEAIALYDEGASLLVSTGSARELAVANAGLAAAYRGLGRLEIALTTYTVALEVLEGLPPKRLSAQLKTEKASVCLSLGYSSLHTDLREARRFAAIARRLLETALATFKELEDAQGEANCYSDLARCIRLELLATDLISGENLNDVIRMIASISEAERRLKALGNEAELAKVYVRGANTLVDCLPVIGDLSVASELVGRVAAGKAADAVKLYERLGIKDGCLAARIALALALSLSGRQKEAFDTTVMALDDAETLFKSEASPEIVAARFELVTDLPGQLARSALAVRNEEEAFWLVQRAKTIPLRTSMAFAGSAQLRGLNAEDRRQLTELRREVDRTSRLLSGRDWDPEVRAQFAQADFKYQAFVQRLRQRQALSRFQSLQMPTPQDLATAIGPHTAVVEIIPTFVDTFVFVVTQEEAALRIRVTRLPIVLGEIELLRQEVLGAIAGKTGDRKALREAYDRLFARCLQNLPNKIKNLIICPAPPIQDLPFGAFVAADGRYLIESYSVAIAPSATAWWLQRVRARAVGRDGPSLFAAVTHFGGHGGGTIRSGLSALPEAVTEVRQAARAVGGRARVLVDGEATVESFLEEAQRARIIHIATHGRSNFYSPLMGYFVLAPSPANSGYLYGQDILQTGLAADLVVLSACRGYLGQQTIAGPVGPAWAFLVAGCSSVVSSLWDVDSKATKDWMLSFYESFVKRGKSKAESVQIACKTFLAKAEYRHPYYWAAWALMGSDR